MPATSRRIEAGWALVLTRPFGLGTEEPVTTLPVIERQPQVQGRPHQGARSSRCDTSMAGLERKASCPQLGGAIKLLRNEMAHVDPASEARSRGFS